VVSRTAASEIGPRSAISTQIEAQPAGAMLAIAVENTFTR
jgi:hypothetical protein